MKPEDENKRNDAGKGTEPDPAGAADAPSRDVHHDESRQNPYEPEVGEKPGKEGGGGD